MFHEDISSVQHSMRPKMAATQAESKAISADSESTQFEPPQLKPTRDDPSGLHKMFTPNEIKVLKQALGAISDNDLLQKLHDPPKQNRPSTNMNRTGGMQALKLTYCNQKQYELGTCNRSKPMRTAYQGPVKDREVLRVHPSKNTYVNLPNKTQEILKKRGVPQSKILQNASNPIQKPPLGGLTGPLKVEMETCKPGGAEKAKSQKKDNT